ncbi:hypothetical protein E2C01_031171 [Portunus trituberculatus]|uniref:Uncharacterized protein n=1 Tax=Portunus trituberculatus TaxID=210409 RepID=A0A5B7ESB5_PORTR|nr:hypothetical protein [Portunus trituberculatus]
MITLTVGKQQFVFQYKDWDLDESSHGGCQRVKSEAPEGKVAQEVTDKGERDDAAAAAAAVQSLPTAPVSPSCHSVCTPLT